MLLVKVPSSQGSLEKNLGCELAPDLLTQGLQGVDEVEVVQNDIVETDKRIYEKALSTFPQKAIFLGGDHSITYSLFKAFSEKFQNPSLIVFDAHPDAMKGIKPVSHEDMNRELIEDG